MKKLPRLQSGQALLIIILIMFIGLTISLTLIARTTTDIKLSREIEESSRALSAAEAGIEEALRNPTIAGAGAQTIGSQGATFEVNSALASGGTGPFSLAKIEKENVGTVWLSNQDESPAYTHNILSLCWSEVDADLPDIEAIILYKEGTDYKVSRVFFEHGSAGGGTEDCGGLYSYETDISLPAGGGRTLLALRLKPINGDALIAVDPINPNELPEQGTEYISTGKAGETTRKVRVFKSYPSWPEIFDYTLFSGGSLEKQ